MDFLNKKCTFFFMLFCTIASLSACLSEITLDVPEGNRESIAIRGVLMAAEVPYVQVRITKVSDFKKFEIPETVDNAAVVLTDDLGHRLDIPMREAGEYELIIPNQTGELEVKTGGSYQLSVTTTEGKTYMSTLETLHSVPVPTRVEPFIEKREVVNTSGNIVEQSFLRFLIDTPVLNPDNSGRAYLKWSFLGTYKFTESTINLPMPPLAKTCYFFEDLNLEKVVVFNSNESREAVLSDYFILEEPLDYRFYEGFYLSIFQQSLNAGAYRYWDELSNVVDQSGSFFEAQPGKVKGNFHNVEEENEAVFGYFYATQEEVLRYYIGPGEYPISRLCPTQVEPNDDFVNSACLNCLSRPNSTLDKPVFWDE